MTDNFTIDVDIQDYVNAKQRETYAKLNCMRIGVINEILPNNEVQCLITNKKLMGINPDGTQIVKEYPPIYARTWFMGCDAFSVEFPLTVGMPCLLLFNDREFQSYFSTGQISSLASPRTHSLNDCVCIPLKFPELDENGLSSSDFNIKAVGKTLNLHAANINLFADFLVLDATDTINISAPNVIINGIKWEEHVHGNGNEGANTTGVVI